MPRLGDPGPDCLGEHGIDAFRLNRSYESLRGPGMGQDISLRDRAGARRKLSADRELPASPSPEQESSWVAEPSRPGSRPARRARRCNLAAGTKTWSCPPSRPATAREPPV